MKTKTKKPKSRAQLDAENRWANYVEEPPFPIPAWLIKNTFCVSSVKCMLNDRDCWGHGPFLIALKIAERLEKESIANRASVFIQELRDGKWHERIQDEMCAMDARERRGKKK